MRSNSNNGQQVLEAESAQAETSERTQELQAYFDRCAAHDWFYAMSDADAVFRRGNAVRVALTNEAAQDVGKAEIFTAWREHKFEHGPAPVRPE